MGKHVRNLLTVFMVCFTGLVSSAAFAGGKISAKVVRDLDQKEDQLILGMPVYTRIAPGLAWLSWVGAGLMENNSDENWYKIEEGLETYCGALSYGIGASYELTPAYEQDVTRVYANVAIQLW